MVKAASPTRSSPRHGASPKLLQLHVSLYDRVSSMLLALLLIVGVLVGLLFVVWLSTHLARKPKALPVKFEPIGGGFENGVGTEGQEIDAPTESEIAAESDIVDQELPDTLSAIVDVASTREADLDRFDQRFEENQKRSGGRSTGTGNAPAKGSGGGHGGGAAREQRWELRFADGNSLETYARQLDQFGIELGIFGSGNEIIYLSNLSRAAPTKRVGLRTEETRMYMTWTRGDLDRADAELFSRAGVDAKGRVILKFFSPETEQRMATLERQYKNREVKDIRRTRYSIRQRGGDFEMFVLDQLYY